MADHRPYQPCPDEDADDDRGQASDQVDDEADRPREAAAAVLGQVDSGADADGDADQARRGQHHQCSDNRRRDTTTDFTWRQRPLGEEREVQSGQAVDGHVCQDGHQHKHANHGADDDQARGDQIGELPATITRLGAQEQ